MKKPTQFWFIGCKPQNNICFEAEYTHGNHGYKDITKSKNGKSIAAQRSEIHPDYANRFIREFILEARS